MLVLFFWSATNFSGVPQGSILSPLLFFDLHMYIGTQVIYVYHLSYGSILFTDNTKLQKIIYLSDQSRLQQDLARSTTYIATWSIDSDLLFSINRCTYLSLNNTISTWYSVGSNTLPQLRSHCDLGLLVS